jgi:hypothetical protein
MGQTWQRRIRCFWQCISACPPRLDRQSLIQQGLTTGQTSWFDHGSNIMAIQPSQCACDNGPDLQGQTTPKFWSNMGQTTPKSGQTLVKPPGSTDDAMPPCIQWSNRVQRAVPTPAPRPRLPAATGPPLPSDRIPGPNEGHTSDPWSKQF